MIDPAPRSPAPQLSVYDQATGLAAWLAAGFLAAAGLLLPYLFWVCFAALLNNSIWRLNPAMPG